MEKHRELVFAKFTEDDVEKLSDIMRRSFDMDAKIHLGIESGGPTGYDNGDYLRKWYLDGKATPFVILKNDAPIGGICLWINEDKINYLGNIFLDPSCQDKGLGTMVWRLIEQKYPDTIKWQTETPAFSTRNHVFYVNKCGFSVVKINNYKDGQSASYFMEKVMA